MKTITNTICPAFALFASTRLASKLSLVLSSALFLQSCTELDQNLSKAVVMKYVHVANVRMFQSDSIQYAGVDFGSFWAVFDICSLDIQGSALNGFNYSAGGFFIETASAKYGSATPGNINTSLGVMSSQSLQVTNAASNAFKLSPTTQFFPKQFYPNLKYRIAIFVKEAPIGYQGDSMTLKYDGQPQVAAVVQNVSPGNPQLIPFYSAGGPPIVGSCP